MEVHVSKRQATLFQSHQQLYSMTKSQNTTTATRARAKSKASTTKKQGHIYKWKPTNDPIDSEEFSDPEHIQLPHRKCAKQSADDDDKIETVDDEPEDTISVVSLGSDRDDRGSSTEEVYCCIIL